MAARKKRALTPEERLAAALVPESEWPYEVPGNWCWVRGAGLFRPMRTAVPTGDFFRYIDIESIDNQKQEVSEPKVIPVDKAPSRARRKLTVGDTVFSMVRPYLKNIAYIDEPLEDCIASTGFYVCSPAEYLDGQFLYYLMCCGYVVDGLNAFMKGDNSPSIKSGDIERFPFPLPPMHEQRRIASRIEWLFAKLDDAEAELREVIDSAEQRQAAILHKAFTGELSAVWRSENQRPQSSWERVMVKNVCKDVKVGIVIKPSQYYTDKNSGTRAFRSANVREFRIEDSDWVYISDEGMNSNQRSVVHTGDVLIVRSGNPGTACVVDEAFDGCNAIDILIAVPDRTKVIPEYLCAFTNSPDGKALVAQNKRGVALMHFNVKSYSALEMPLPSIEEQHIVVNELNHLLDNQRLVRGRAEIALASIKTLRNSILAKALRGKLGTNDPNDPSSKELLANIINDNAGK